MSQENESDPWEEVEGIPPLVKKLYRTPPGEERSWLTTLHEMRGLADWLSGRTLVLYESISQTPPEDPFMSAIDMWSHVLDKLQRSAEECLAVQQLLWRLFDNLRDELMKALSVSDAGPDE